MRPPRAAALLMLLAVILAGCAAPGPSEELESTAAAVDGVDAAVLPSGTGGGDAAAADASLGGANGTAAAAVPLPVAARLVLGQRVELDLLACAAGCLPTRLEVDVELGAWRTAEGILEVRIGWDGTQQAGARVVVEPPGGEPVGLERGFDSARALVLNPGAGTYLVRVEGKGSVEAWAAVRHLAALQGEGDDLLPNLVTLPPTDVGFGACDPWEQVEQQAKRCLRLANAVGNVGDGPLEVRLAHEEGALTPAGMGEFVQRIHQRVGTPREAPVGGADFHATHGHFHYHWLARFSLHPVDPVTGLRSEAVASGQKAGFCLLDIGRLSGIDVHVEEFEERHAEQACLVPGKGGWTMGVSRGWYDLYGSGLTDQYVEMTDVPDGVYELVSETDWAGTIVELDESDNAASVLLRIAGDDVDVLEKRGFYRAAAS